MTEAMTNLSELAARIEAAEGPDQALDRQIWYTLQDEMTGDPVHRPAFTGSVDAALSLVPDGWGWSIHTSDFPGAFIAEVELEGREHGARATTPALALACAALRAKEVSDHG